MNTCGGCAFYLCFKARGYNCGYLIKRVEERKDACTYFRSAGACSECEPFQEIPRSQGRKQRSALK